MILVILAVILFIAYNVFILTKYRTIPVSLSETSYIASPTWFSSVIGTETILLLVPWLDNSPEPILPYLSSIALVVCASSPLFKESFHKTTHYISALVALAGIILWMAIHANPLWWTSLVVLAGLIVWKKEQFVYWTELWAFAALSGILLVP